MSLLYQYRYVNHYNFFQDTTIQTLQEDNNVEWQKFIENIANSCNQIDKIFKEKEDELKNFYTDLEKKLGLNNSMQS